jgi:hypothetical protein
MQTETKRARVAVLISHKMDFQSNMAKTKKEYHYTMIRG